MKYDLQLRIKRKGDKKYMYNKHKKNKSLLYVVRTLFSWFINDNRTFNHTLTIKRARK